MSQVIDYEEIVKRFSIVDDSSTSDDAGFGASKDQLFEFKLAFRMIAKGNDSVSYAGVNDIFLSLGFTLPEVTALILSL
jgi:hypothetical protein